MYKKISARVYLYYLKLLRFKKLYCVESNMVVLKLVEQFLIPSRPIWIDQNMSMVLQTHETIFIAILYGFCLRTFFTSNQIQSTFNLDLKSNKKYTDTWGPIFAEHLNRFYLIPIFFTNYHTQIIILKIINRFSRNWILILTIWVKWC